MYEMYVVHGIHTSIQSKFNSTETKPMVAHSCRGHNPLVLNSCSSRPIICLYYILQLDSLGYQHNERTTQTCNKHNITVYRIPPHTTAWLHTIYYLVQLNKH